MVSVPRGTQTDVRERPATNPPGLAVGSGNGNPSEQIANAKFCIMNVNAVVAAAT